MKVKVREKKPKEGIGSLFIDRDGDIYVKASQYGNDDATYIRITHVRDTHMDKPLPYVCGEGVAEQENFKPFFGKVTVELG